MKNLIFKTIKILSIAIGLLPALVSLISIIFTITRFAFTGNDNWLFFETYARATVFIVLSALLLAGLMAVSDKLQKL